MILLVPISPEVPKFHRPRFGPSIFFIISLAIVFLELLPTLNADTEYIENVQELIKAKTYTAEQMKEDANYYLKTRALLRVSPARGDWDLRRLIMANFIHGSIPHLALNMLGLFAAVRICSTFLPFLCILAVFLVGGSAGLFVSMKLTQQFSDFIPHVGASAGIFTLMGAYYIYNFRFRTSYFFWFPHRRGVIALKTNWFFFVDVIMLELVLSTAQLFPDRLDAVDHIAHVVGFAAGMGLALVLRSAQKWPSFLQTRGEFLYWNEFVRPRMIAPGFRPFLALCEMVELNRYNDPLKLQLLNLVLKEAHQIPDADLNDAFKFFRPTFVRLYSNDIARTLKTLYFAKRRAPARWLAKLPYDNLIRVAKAMAHPVEEQSFLIAFINDYRKFHTAGSDVDRKLELLMARLEAAVSMPRSEPPSNVPSKKIPQQSGIARK